MAQPFNSEVGRFIFRLSYLSLGTGLFSWWGVKYAGWLSSQRGYDAGYTKFAIRRRRCVAVYGRYAFCDRTNF